MLRFSSAAFVVLIAATTFAADNTPPEGFQALFNGKDFTGFHGVGTEDPRKIQALPEAERTERFAKSLDDLKEHWKIENGELVNDGKGLYMTTDKDYGDYELHVEWKLIPKGDSGVYLKGTPQVQIWDTSEEAGYHKLGADKGSGGLWNNSAGAPGKDPVILADKPVGEWNKFRILQAGARTTVYLNDKLVVDRAILENYFDKNKTPLVPKGPVQLQTHGNEVRWKNIYIRELSAEEAQKAALGSDEGFKSLFNGKDLEGWAGPVENYEVADGVIRCKPGKGGVIYAKDEYADFVVRLEFKLPPGGNNGLAIRYPGQGDTAYVGMCELQVLDTEHPKYANLDPRQAHGSAYGMAAAHRGYHRPTGEWNFQEVTVKGSTIKVELNGSVILDTDLSKITEYMANSPHPGKDRTSGFFGFAGHSDPVEFRNIRIKALAAQ
ncbi:MAG TPA: DUF1080 domain-containing protein [Planctomycetaceae bacterium]|nr:DUF1080 domain-containing protein [Planctomycetaceae bacterium]